MEKMPFQDVAAATARVETDAAVGFDWRLGLPALRSGDLTLRELQPTDAASMLTMLTTEEVARFISPPPTTVAGFERFIAWTHAERRAGRYICFAIVPRGLETAVGLIQVRQLDTSFETAEWGFAVGSGFWGTGLFMTSAQMVVDFVFNIVGVHRLEARAAIANGRGNGALRKLGAVCEGVLRRSFLRNGEYLDQQLWAILDCDWAGARRWQKPTVN